MMGYLTSLITLRVLMDICKESIQSSFLSLFSLISFYYSYTIKYINDVNLFICSLLYILFPINLDSNFLIPFKRRRNNSSSFYFNYFKIKFVVSKN